MTNTLHSFGCSFSEHFLERLENSYLNHDVLNSYLKLYKRDDLKSWHEYISNDLNLELNIQGHSGGSNYQIFESLCNSVDKFKENDIIIVEWSYVNRFRLSGEDSENWTPILSNHSEHSFIDKESLNKILYLRETKNQYKNEIISYMNIINSLCDSKNIKVFYWTIDHMLFNYFYDNNHINDSWLFFDKHSSNFNYVEFILNNGGLKIEDEVNHKDPHFGIAGNKIFGELSNDYIKNYLKIS